jgi:hypothetical protein
MLKDAQRNFTQPISDRGPMPARTRRFGIVVLTLLFWSGRDATAQSRIDVDVSAAAVAAGEGRACQYRADYKAPVAGMNDSIVVRVYEDSTYKKLAPLPSGLSVSLASLTKKEIPRGDTIVRIPVGNGGLAERVISLSRVKSTEPLCVFEPFPYRSSGPRGNPFTTHTDIMASGEISNALRSGTSGGEATGSLGFHHKSFTKPGHLASYFPFFSAGNADTAAHWIRRALRKASYRVDGEDLRATIGVAGTTDTLRGPTRASFAEAVIAPTSAARGNAGSLDMQYRPFMEYGGHQSVGFLFRFVGTRSLWQPDTLRLAKTAVLLGADARLHWVVINHQKEDDVNNLVVALDFGYVVRGIGGDGGRDSAVKTAALGTTHDVFQGNSTGVYLTLRQVTAFADFMCLSCFPFKSGKRLLSDGRKGRSKIEGLEGLQPRIGFRFEAPFVTIR